MKGRRAPPKADGRDTTVSLPSALTIETLQVALSRMYAGASYPLVRSEQLYQDLADRLLRMGWYGTRISLCDVLACRTDEQLIALIRWLPTMPMPEPSPVERGAVSGEEKTWINEDQVKAAFE